MKQILHLFLFGFLFVSFTYAQSDSQKCPSISIEGPSLSPKAGDKIPFRVVLSNDFNRSNLKYIWSVDKGKILSGQGTQSILIVDPTSPMTTPTATVVIEGLPESCPNTYSESAPVCGCVEIVLVNEYQKLTGVEENKKLDTLICEMHNSPAARGFIQKSFPSGQSKADVYQHLKRILDYLVVQAVDVNSITFGVVYGKNIEETSLYLIPPGAENPEIEGEVLEPKNLLERLNATNSTAQAKVSLSCPTISVSIPNLSLPDEPFSFAADISKEYDTSKLTYLWTVSAGKIVHGQGTLKIDIDPQKNELVTGTLVIQGLPQNCANTASESYICSHCYSPREILPEVLTIDEYNRLPVNEEKLRLNKFANELKNHPDAMVFITKSFTRNVSKITAYRDLQRILNFLESRGTSKNRIIFGATYDKNEQTIIHIVPPGAKFPKYHDETLNAEQLAAKLKSVKTSSRKKPRRKN